MLKYTSHKCTVCTTVSVQFFGLKYFLSAVRPTLLFFVLTGGGPAASRFCEAALLKDTV